MIIKFSSEFDDQFASLSKNQKQLATDAIELFLDNPDHEALRNHPLTEEWAGWNSISASYDLRVHYKQVDTETILFVAVGKHSDLYK